MFPCSGIPCWPMRLTHLVHIVYQDTNRGFGSMGWQGCLTLIVLALMVIALTSEWAPPDVVLMGGLCSMAATRILTPTETFAGFANESVATIGALLVMAAALPAP